MNVETKTTAGQAMGIIGIVLAVISLILAFIPCIGVVAFLPAGLALIFSIISIIQAANGYGSKSLGIGALIVSLISILLAAVWLAIFSGTMMVADRAIKNSDKLELFGKEFEKAFENEMGKEDVHLEIVSDSLENALRDLENDANITDKEKAHKAGEAAAKALKKTTKVIIDTDSVKIQIESKKTGK